MGLGGVAEGGAIGVAGSAGVTAMGEPEVGRQAGATHHDCETSH